MAEGGEVAKLAAEANSLEGPQREEELVNDKLLEGIANSLA